MCFNLYYTLIALSGMFENGFPPSHSPVPPSFNSLNPLQYRNSKMSIISHQQLDLLLISHLYCICLEIYNYVQSQDTKTSKKYELKTKQRVLDTIKESPLLGRATFCI